MSTIIDLDEAKRNRERIARHENEAYYHDQAKLNNLWNYGTRPPQGLALGELPEVTSSHKPVSKHIREE